MAKLTSHPALKGFLTEHRAETMDRREFMTRVTALGVAAPVAYTALGMAAPLKAQDAVPKRGGTVRIAQTVRAMKDPRTFDWAQLSNVTRGWLEYLVQYNPDGTFTPFLLTEWEANDNATEYTLHLREGVTWNNGDPFTAADVKHNIARWADASVEGNSMATRLSSLAQDGKMRDDAVEIIDDVTLKLHLSFPDITIIPTFSDYTAGVVHPSYDNGNPVDNPIGTGPYLPESYETGARAILVRNPDHNWWGEGAYLDRIEFLDFGTDPSAVFAGADAGQFDTLYLTAGDFIPLYDSIGWQKSESITASTLSVRMNQMSAPYDDVRVRNAMQLAVNNHAVLALGYGGLGIVGKNDMVCPIQPEYADLPFPEADPDKALKMMEESGYADFEHELISVDDDYERQTCDVIAAQIREAGIPIKRTIIPGATFWNDWLIYPFSGTSWAHRPLAVQTLDLAFRSDAAWNDSAFSNEEFDALLDEALSIADPDKRRDVSAQLQQILRDQGVTIQSFWRSTYRHAAPGLLNAQQHPVFEFKLAEMGWEA